VEGGKLYRKTTGFVDAWKQKNSLRARRFSSDANQLKTQQQLHVYADNSAYKVGT